MIVIIADFPVIGQLNKFLIKNDASKVEFSAIFGFAPYSTKPH